MEKSLSAREKAVSMLHPPISVGSYAWSHARSRSAWGEASARAMLSKDLRMRLCANSRASHATLGGVILFLCVCEWLLLSTISVVLLLTLQVPVAKHLPFASLAPDASSPGGRGPAPHGAGQTV